MNLEQLEYRALYAGDDAVSVVEAEMSSVGESELEPWTEESESIKDYLKQIAIGLDVIGGSALVLGTAIVFASTSLTYEDQGVLRVRNLWEGVAVDNNNEGSCYRSTLLTLGYSAMIAGGIVMMGGVTLSGIEGVENDNHQNLSQ